jgi:2-hydroxycyclohexanecarboxyl-CoA dehydrogenase
MSGRVAIVTGAASGIGLGVANRLAADGIAVALLDRDDAGVTRAADALTGAGHAAVGHAVDVADRAELERVFSDVRQALGPITILVTSAGIESFDAVADITPEKWDRILAVNLTGTFTCMQLAVPDMAAEGWGRIVTISSSSAQSGAPHMAHYVASKGGVIGLTKAFAREFASQGVTVNTIPPTIVDTPMARNAAGVGNVPSIDVMGSMVPTGRAGTP